MTSLDEIIDKYKEQLCSACLRDPCKCRGLGYKVSMQNGVTFVVKPMTKQLAEAMCVSGRRSGKAQRVCKHCGALKFGKHKCHKSPVVARPMRLCPKCSNAAIKKGFRVCENCIGSNRAPEMMIPLEHCFRCGTLKLRDVKCPRCGR